jgi:hypothetical protein
MQTNFMPAVCVPRPAERRGRVSAALAHVGDEAQLVIAGDL